MYAKTVFAQSCDTLHIIGNGFVAHKLIPKDFVVKGVFNNHQAEASTPIGCIHIYDYLLVFGYHSNMAYRVKMIPNRLYTYPMFPRELC